MQHQNTEPASEVLGICTVRQHGSAHPPRLLQRIENLILPCFWSWQAKHFSPDALLIRNNGKQLPQESLACLLGSFLFVFPLVLPQRAFAASDLRVGIFLCP